MDNQNIKTVVDIATLICFICVIYLIWYLIKYSKKAIPWSMDKQTLAYLLNHAPEYCVHDFYWRGDTVWFKNHTRSKAFIAVCPNEFYGVHPIDGLVDLNSGHPYWMEIVFTDEYYQKIDAERSKKYDESSEQDDPYYIYPYYICNNPDDPRSIWVPISQEDIIGLAFVSSR